MAFMQAVTMQTHAFERLPLRWSLGEQYRWKFKKNWCPK